MRKPVYAILNMKRKKKPMNQGVAGNDKNKSLRLFI